MRETLPVVTQAPCSDAQRIAVAVLGRTAPGSDVGRCSDGSNWEKKMSAC